MTEEIPTKTIINCETQEVTVVPLTEEELAARAEASASVAAVKAAEAAAAEALAALKESAKAKLIAGTPLTEEEASAIVL